MSETTKTSFRRPMIALGLIALAVFMYVSIIYKIVNFGA